MDYSDVDDIYSEILPLIKKIRFGYRFVGLNNDDFVALIKKIIKENPSDESIELNSYYKKVIIDGLNNLVREKIKSGDYTVVSNYVRIVLPKNSKYGDIKAGLDKFDDFFSILKIDYSFDMLAMFMQNIPELNQAVEVVFKKNEKAITNGDFDRFGVVTSGFLQSYCDANNIKIAEVSDDASYLGDAPTGLKAILGMINDFPVIDDVDKQRQLIREAQNGNLESRDLFINSNLRLVLSVVKKYQNLGLDLEDLFSEGTFGLYNAIDKFDLQRGTTFTTYAVWWIRQSVLRAIENTGKNIRIPVHNYQTLSKLNSAEQKLSLKFDRKPTVQELSLEVGCSVETVKRLLGIRKKAEVLSLDFEVDDDSNTTFSNLLPDSTVNIETDFFRKNLKADVIKLLSSLNFDKRERDILLLRFGMASDDSKVTLEVLGSKYGLTRERIRQIEKGALKKIVRCKDTENLAIYMSSPEVALCVLRELRAISYNKKGNTVNYSVIACKLYQKYKKQLLMQGTISTTNYSKPKEKVVSKSNMSGKAKGGEKMPRRGERKTIFELLGITKDEWCQFIEPSLTECDYRKLHGLYGDDLECPDLSIKMLPRDRAVIVKLRKKCIKLGIGIGKDDTYKQATENDICDNMDTNSIDTDIKEDTLSTVIDEEVVTTDDSKEEQILGDSSEEELKVKPKEEAVGNKCSKVGTTDDTLTSLATFDDATLDSFISNLNSQCEEIEERIKTKRSKLDVALSLLERKNSLLQRERDLDRQISEKINGKDSQLVK